MNVYYALLWITVIGIRSNRVRHSRRTRKDIDGFDDQKRVYLIELHGT